jgi:hypothetical protein
MPHPTTLKTIPFIPGGATYKQLLPTESVIKLQACMYAAYQHHNHLNDLCYVHMRVCVCAILRRHVQQCLDLGEGTSQNTYR